MATTRGLVRMAVPAAVLLLGACTTLGPDFTRPQVPWLEGWSGGAWRTLADEAPRRAAARADDEWWRQFDDPVLEQLVDEAQRLNPGVRTAGLRILEARAQLGIAGSGLYPQLQQVSADGLRVGNRGSDGHSTALLDRSAPAFDVAWELDFWGKFRRGIESADAAYFASIAQYDDVQVLVAAQAASLYAIDPHHRAAAAHRARERRAAEAQPRDHRAAVSQRQRVRARRAAGAHALPEHAGDDPRAREQPAPDAERAVRPARTAARPAARAGAAGARRFPKRELEVIVDMPADLLRRRPDVRAAEMQLAAQSAQIGVSKAALYPSIALAGSVGLSATSHRLAQRPRSTGASAPRCVWNVFDYGRLTNQVLVQDARFQQLYEQYQDTVLRAARELDDAAIGFAYSPRAGRDPARCGAGGAALARHRRRPVPRRAGRLPARARFAARAVQPAGASGDHARAASSQT